MFRLTSKNQSNLIKQVETTWDVTELTLQMANRAQLFLLVKRVYACFRKLFLSFFGKIQVVKKTFSRYRVASRYIINKNCNIDEERKRQIVVVAFDLQEKNRRRDVIPCNWMQLVVVCTCQQYHTFFQAKNQFSRYVC